MSSTGSSHHSKRLASETDNAQRGLDNDSAQHLRLRDRPRCFEEVFQQEVDVYTSSSHLHIDCKKPPMGSISSMEVNVDMLDMQMDLIDISDQEALDVFLNSGADDQPPASPMPEMDYEEEEEDEAAEVVFRQGLPPRLASDGRPACSSRMSSTSSRSSDTSAEGADTPVIQSDDEEVHADTLLLTSAPQARDEDSEED